MIPSLIDTNRRYDKREGDRQKIRAAKWDKIHALEAAMDQIKADIARVIYEADQREKDLDAAFARNEQRMLLGELSEAA